MHNCLRELWWEISPFIKAWKTFKKKQKYGPEAMSWKNDVSMLTFLLAALYKYSMHHCPYFYACYFTKQKSILCLSPLPLSQSKPPQGPHCPDPCTTLLSSTVAGPDWSPAKSVQILELPFLITFLFPPEMSKKWGRVCLQLTYTIWLWICHLSHIKANKSCNVVWVGWLGSQCQFFSAILICHNNEQAVKHDHQAIKSVLPC